jgi:hypothetical protein
MPAYVQRQIIELPAAAGCAEELRRIVGDDAWPHNPAAAAHGIPAGRKPRRQMTRRMTAADKRNPKVLRREKKPRPNRRRSFHHLDQPRGIPRRCRTEHRPTSSSCGATLESGGLDADPMQRSSWSYLIRRCF